jgi:DNA-binding NarL/FixJ family response regulator
VSASVLIVDDHPILLQGCRRILEDIGIKAIFEARDVVGDIGYFAVIHPT